MADRPGSEPYNRDNLLDRHSRQATLDHHYALMQRRERELLDRRLGLSSGRVLSIGAGWHPGRHLFPAPAFELVAADADPAKVAGVLETGRADEAVVGYAGRLGLAPRSFDVVLYRLVLHHIAYQGPLAPCFDEAAALLCRGARSSSLSPGCGIRSARRWPAPTAIGLGPASMARPTMSRCPPVGWWTKRSPPGSDPELHTVTYAWRRLSPAAQRAAGALDRPLGSRAVSARFGHTLMLIARSRRRA